MTLRLGSHARWTAPEHPFHRMSTWRTVRAATYSDARKPRHRDGSARAARAVSAAGVAFSPPLVGAGRRRSLRVAKRPRVPRWTSGGTWARGAEALQQGAFRERDQRYVVPDDVIERGIRSGEYAVDTGVRRRAASAPGARRRRSSPRGRWLHGFERTAPSGCAFRMAASRRRRRSPRIRACSRDPAHAYAGVSRRWRRAWPLSSASADFRAVTSLRRVRSRDAAGCEQRGRATGGRGGNAPWRGRGDRGRARRLRAPEPLPSRRPWTRLRDLPPLLRPDVRVALGLADVDALPHAGGADPRRRLAGPGGRLRDAGAHGCALRRLDPVLDADRARFRAARRAPHRVRARPLPGLRDPLPHARERRGLRVRVRAVGARIDARLARAGARDALRCSASRQRQRR